jgi:hypothetical protein
MYIQPSPLFNHLLTICAQLSSQLLTFKNYVHHFIPATFSISSQPCMYNHHHSSTLSQQCVHIQPLPHFQPSPSHLYSTLLTFSTSDQPCLYCTVNQNTNHIFNRLLIMCSRYKTVTKSLTVSQPRVCDHHHHISRPCTTITPSSSVGNHGHLFNPSSPCTTIAQFSSATITSSIPSFPCKP